MKALWPFVFIFILLGPITAQEEETPRNILDDRRDVLRYGIDSEVVSLLQTLGEEEEDKLNDEVLEIYRSSKNSELRTEAAKLFTTFKYEGAKNAVVEVLEEYPEEEKLLLSSLSYLTAIEARDQIDLIESYTDSENPSVAAKAVGAVGQLGGPDEAERLREIYDEDERPGTVRAEALSALGKLGDANSIEFLTEILNDESLERSFRWRACQALGDIGDPESLPAIESALNDDDTILRTYAVRALREFDSDEVYELFVESLRDSFWRVRLAAIETLGERGESRAIDILEYKALRDPEEKIKLAAIDALGRIGGSKSFGILKEIAESESYGMSMRVAALNSLGEHNFAGSFKTFDAIIEQEWDTPDSRLLVELVKVMTKGENPKLASYFERFIAHSNVSIVLMGLKGIERNRFASLREKVEELSEARTAASVRKSARSVLDSL